MDINSQVASFNQGVCAYLAERPSEELSASSCPNRVVICHERSSSKYASGTECAEKLEVKKMNSTRCRSI